MKRSLCLLPVMALVLMQACTKEREVPKGPDGKPMISRQANPDRVVFEAMLDVPKEFRDRVKKTDLMIWDIKTAEGEVVSAQITPVPPFPALLSITARQLFEPLPEGAHLLFSARIVKFGDEGKPPQKGQLQVLVGMNPPSGELVENKAATPKLVDKFMKKLKIAPAEEVIVGAKTKADFAPAFM